MVEGLIFKGSRLVIPSAMRQEMLDKIHEGHMGISKSKQRSRESVYWPGISVDVDNMIQGCSTCVEFSPAQQKETLQPQDIPQYPWQKVGADLFSITGQNYLVVADYFSLYPEVNQLSNITTAAVKKALAGIFSRHGIPEELFTDNGSQLR